MIESSPATGNPAVSNGSDDEDSIGSNDGISYVQQLRQQQQNYFEKDPKENKGHESEAFFNAFEESAAGFGWAEDIIDHGEAEVLVVESQQTHVHHAPPDLQFATVSQIEKGYDTDGDYDRSYQRGRAMELGLDSRSEHSRNSSHHSNRPDPNEVLFSYAVDDLPDKKRATKAKNKASSSSSTKGEDSPKRSGLSRSSSENALNVVQVPLQKALTKKSSFRQPIKDSDDQSRVSKASRRNSISKEKRSKKKSFSYSDDDDMESVVSHRSRKSHSGSKKKKKKSGSSSVCGDTEKKKSKAGDLRSTLKNNRQRSNKSVGTKSTASRSSSVPATSRSSAPKSSSLENKKISVRDGVSLEQQLKRDRRRARRSKSARDDDDESSVASSVLDQSRLGAVRAVDPNHRMMRRFSNEVNPSNPGSLGHHFANSKGPMQLNTDAMSLHGGEKRYGRNLGGGFSSTASLPGGAPSRRTIAKLRRSTSSENVVGKKKRVPRAGRRSSFNGDGTDDVSVDGVSVHSADDGLDDILSRSRQTRGRAKRHNSISNSSISNADNSANPSLTRRATISSSSSLMSTQTTKKKKQQSAQADSFLFDAAFPSSESPPESPVKKGGARKGMDLSTMGSSVRETKSNETTAFDDLDGPIVGTTKKKGGLVSRIFGGGRR